jgi:hypothetical protein
VFRRKDVHIYICTQQKQERIGLDMNCIDKNNGMEGAQLTISKMLVLLGRKA